MNTLHTPSLNSSASCPLEPRETECILLAHGEGGLLMRRLLEQHIGPALGLDSRWEDAAYLPVINGQVAVTTDSFVVSPLFFPGGDIGSLAVYGTVNDLAVSGARPLAITLALILEEGLPLALLQRVLQSVKAAADRCGVRIIAGDTKVVPRGAVDRLFINTTGIGQRTQSWTPGCEHIRVGDRLVVSGPIGNHGIAVLTAREQLGLVPEPTSDSAPLHTACQRLLAELGDAVHALRDATRGGVSAVMHEWAAASGLTMRLKQAVIPVSPAVRGACELLGLDPLYVANEGTFVAAVDATAADRAVAVLRALPGAHAACAIGEVIPQLAAPVVIERLFGTLQPLDEPTGSPLPRIC
jgi:hydrogenase expression/formation protein HypE